MSDYQDDKDLGVDEPVIDYLATVHMLRASITRKDEEIARLKALLNDPCYQECCDMRYGLQADLDRVMGLLEELTAVVRGECPSLLNEDSGGDARLSCAIDSAIQAWRARQGKS